MSDAVRLRETLARLRTELAVLDADDTEHRRLLRGAIDDIEARLDATDPDWKPEDHDGYADQLRDAEASFASDHPKIAAAVRGVLDALHSFGI